MSTIVTRAPSEDLFVSSWYRCCQLLHRDSQLHSTMDKVPLVTSHVYITGLTNIKISETVSMEKFSKGNVISSIIVHRNNATETRKDCKTSQCSPLYTPPTQLGNDLPRKDTRIKVLHFVMAGATKHQGDELVVEWVKTVELI